MRILLLGGTGQVGQEFRTLSRSGSFDVVAPSRDVLDLQNPEAIAKAMAFVAELLGETAGVEVRTPRTMLVNGAVISEERTSQ